MLSDSSIDEKINTALIFAWPTWSCYYTGAQRLENEWEKSDYGGSESSHLILIKKANTPVTHTIKITQIDCWVQVDLDFDKSHPLLACTCTLLQTKRTPFGSGPQQQWPPQNSRNGMSRTTETEALT